MNSADPNKQILDGCTAATHVAYAFSEVATIYPITPIASMGETADKWAVAGRKNLFGGIMEVKEMESELGAAGATHGALTAGAFATTFTSSQGLMLMIPNMYKMAGELLPAVFHVGTRSLATHALSIFGDHQDVMACRATGFAFLCSNSVQETMDLAVVAHVAAINGSVPVLHFFDGWRTSNELSTISVIPYADMLPLLDKDKVAEFRRRALNPEHPTLFGSAQNPDVYFQNREAANKYYDRFPAIVREAMRRIGEITGRHYCPVDYYGDPEATHVTVAMGSSCEVLERTVDWLNSHGHHTGVVKVRLYRPFPVEDFLTALPATVKRIAVLDRTKEPGSQGEPLYLDVVAAIHATRPDVEVVGGRYGLGSKEFDPLMARAVYENIETEKPLAGFTVGIDDDVTHRSLTVEGEHFIDACPDVKQIVIYGMGSDGSVGATRQIASIISETTPQYAQAFFNYSAKKSGGYTVSQLRYGPAPVKAAYSITDAGCVVCNKDVYVDRFELLRNLRPGGIFLLNCGWSADELSTRLPAQMRQAIAGGKVRLYTIDAQKIASEEGLGHRINMIMATALLSLVADGSLPLDEAVTALKQKVTQIYKHEGGAVVQMNLNAIDRAIRSVAAVQYPASWAVATGSATASRVPVPEYIRNVARPCLRLLGNELPVSALTPDGVMPMGTTAYEKRRIAVNIPVWDPQKCVQCTECSLVCAHAAIRPVLLTPAETAAAPAGFTTAPGHGKSLAGYDFRIQVYSEDCTGCGSCAVICPGHALTMTPASEAMDAQIPLLEYVQAKVSPKDSPDPRATVRGSQFHTPMLEFSGACGGCGETPYVKLLTQLFGERMIIANATGCSSIWGANFPSNAYCTGRDGRGPAWGNSLFEDNAEYGFGMAAAIANRRSRLLTAARTLVADPATAPATVAALRTWIDAYADGAASQTASRALLAAIRADAEPGRYAAFTADADILAKKSIWAIGGDGWAYDIGFAGLDHVLAQDVDINILVMDTECYSNTGGQMSKATPLSAVVKYASDGKRTFKKDLGRMMMTYGNIYVASIALGANYQQTVTALAEAEAYPGPSLVIAYCPCINHGIRSGMSHTIVEERLAVLAGYWQLYRYNPANAEPMALDCAAPDGSLLTFLGGEDRYADLQMLDPEAASVLRPRLAARTARIHTILSALAGS